jgi:hypothetical protein
MLHDTARFLGLFSVGLASGIALAVFFVERVWAGSAQFYTELMQLLNRAFTRPAPVLGAVALLAMATDGALLVRRGSSAAFWLTAAAASLSLVALALTKFGHFPINDRMLQWDPRNPPGDWKSVQARWSALHVKRTFCAVSSFALIALSSLVRE